MSNQITVNDGNADVIYEQISMTNGESIFRDVTSSLSNPSTLRIAHTPAKDPQGTDRHLVQFSKVSDDVDGLPQSGSAHIVLNAPRAGVTKVELELELKKLTTLVLAAFTELYNGFVPLD